MLHMSMNVLHAHACCYQYHENTRSRAACLGWHKQMWCQQCVGVKVQVWVRVHVRVRACLWVCMHMRVLHCWVRMERSKVASRQERCLTATSIGTVRVDSIEQAL